MVTFRVHPFAVLSIIAGSVSAQTFDNPPCNVCGDGRRVGNIDAFVTFPGQPEATNCGDLQEGGLSGAIESQFCPIVPSLIGPCECETGDATPRPVPTATPPPTPRPTNEPTPRPTDGPTPPPSLPPTPSPTTMPGPEPTEPDTPGPTREPTRPPTRPPTPSPTRGAPVTPFPVCSVCGPGQEITNGGGLVQFPGRDPVMCSFLEDAGENGRLTPSECSILSTLIVDSCRCAPIGTPTIPPPPPPPSPSPYELMNVKPCRAHNLCGTCEGRCAHDGQCEDHLRCFQREGFESVPNCSGRGERGVGYCYGPMPTPPGPPAPPVNVSPPPPPTSSNLPELDYIKPCRSHNTCGLCQGRCTNDGQCEGSLKCFTRTAFQPVPGCSSTGRRGNGYCYDPSAGGNPPRPVRQPTRPPTRGQTTRPQPRLDNVKPCRAHNTCGICEGRCTNDRQCAGSLRCFKRNGVEPVPGCSGSGDRGIGYCYGSQNPVRPAPTRPPTRPPTRRPTTPVRRPTSPPNSNYELDYVRPCRAHNKCGLCEGECQHDGQCEDHLRCFKRERFERIPGCSGTGRRGVGYCYKKP